MEEAAKEEEESSSDSDSSGSSSNSSKSSAVGLKKGKAKAKAKARGKKAPPPVAIPQEKQDESTPCQSAPSLASPPDSARSDKSAAPSDSKMMTSAMLQDKALAACKTLDQVTPWMIWGGAIKAKDLDSRLSKALDLATKSESRMNDSGLQNIAVELNKVIGRVTLENNILSGISGAPAATDLREVLRNTDDLHKIFFSFNQEERGSFLSDLGRKLCDFVISTAGEDDTFFHFLSCKRLGALDIFSMRSLESTDNKPPNWSPADGIELDKLIGNVQATSLNYFIDRFRNLTCDVEKVLAAIPKSWYVPEICRTALF